MSEGHRTSKERFTPEYISEVVKELESRGWRPDSRGDPECYDEASAAGAQIIEHLQARLSAEPESKCRTCGKSADSKARNGCHTISCTFGASLEPKEPASNDLVYPGGGDIHDECHWWIDRAFDLREQVVHMQRENDDLRHDIERAVAANSSAHEPKATQPACIYRGGCTRADCTDLCLGFRREAEPPSVEPRALNAEEEQAIGALEDYMQTSGKAGNWSRYVWDLINRLRASEPPDDRLKEAEALILRMSGEGYSRARFYVEKYDLTGERTSATKDDCNG